MYFIFYASREPTWAAKKTLSKRDTEAQAESFPNSIFQLKSQIFWFLLKLSLENLKELIRILIRMRNLSFVTENTQNCFKV